MKGIFWESDFSSSMIPIILKEIYLDRVYAPFMEGRKDLTIIDAGANVGLWSMYAAPFAKLILAVEPCREHFNSCQMMIEANGLEYKVFPLWEALSDKDATVGLYDFPGNATMKSLIKGTGWSEKVQVIEAVTMKTLICNNYLDHVDFMKLDIEGGEAAVLRSPEFAEVAPMIDTIVGEWHQWCDMNKDEMKQRLESLGYRFSWIYRGAQEATMFAAMRNSPKRSIYE